MITLVTENVQIYYTSFINSWMCLDSIDTNDLAIGMFDF